MPPLEALELLRLSLPVCASRSRATRLSRHAGPHEQAIIARRLIWNDEAGPSKERQSPRAGREHQARVAALVGDRGDARQQRRADAAVAGVLAHEQVADVAPPRVRD